MLLIADKVQMNQVPTKAIMLASLVALDRQDGTFDIVKNLVGQTEKKVSLGRVMEIYKQIVDS